MSEPAVELFEIRTVSVDTHEDEKTLVPPPEPLTAGFLAPIPMLIFCVGLIPALVTSALSMTILASGLANISTRLGDTSQLMWMQTAYMLTQAVSEQWVSQIRYTLDRKKIFLTGALIFAIGSAISGLAVSLFMLSVGRAVQGLGAGALVGVSTVLVEHIASKEKISECQGNLGFITALAYIFAPLLGGYINDQGVWRWVFLMNVPAIAVSAAVIFIFLKIETPAESTLITELRRFDFWGVLSLLAGFTLLLLGMSWGGLKYPWLSVFTLVPLILGGVLVIAFFFIEIYVASNPIIPVHLLKLRNPLIVTITQFFVGADLFGEAFFLPLYFIYVKNDSAQQCGAELLSFFLSYALFWVAAGMWLLVYGKFRTLVWMGGAVRGLSVGLLLYLDQYTDGFQIGYLLCGGLGLGLLTKPGKVGAQAAVTSERDKSDIESILTFWRTIGGMSGIALTGTIFLNLLATNLCMSADPTICPLTNQTASWLGPETSSLMGKSAISTSEAVIASTTATAYVAALNVVFRLWIPMACLALVVSLALENKELDIFKFIADDNRYLAAAREAKRTGVPLPKDADVEGSRKAPFGTVVAMEPVAAPQRTRLTDVRDATRVRPPVHC